jgi:4-amino-4-deoxy-L-arabinose transferase-like glycosyltransferase
MKQTTGTAYFFLIIAILIGAVSFLLFHNLGEKPFRIWDESRLAVNSLEMYRDGCSLVPTFESKPDMWNTKPPLLIWIQAASIHLFGISERSIRLPSAIAGLAISLILFSFIYKTTLDPSIALLAALIPVLSPGYLNFHNVRSADYDALLVLLVLGYSIAFFHYTTRKNIRYLYLTALFISLAILTKSTAALLPLPALLVWSLMQQKPAADFTTRHFWLAAAIIMTTTAAYYLLREHVNPGYLRVVDNNEIRGRFLEVNDGNTGDHWFYLKMLMKSRFRYWFWILVAGIPLALLNPSEKIRKVALWSVVQWSVYLLIISISKTKLHWYDLPAYPYMAISIATAFHTLASWSFSIKRCTLKTNLCHAIKSFALLGLMIVPAIEAAKFVTTLKEYPWDEELYEIQYLLKDYIGNKQDLSQYHLVHEGFYQRTVFYLNQAAMDGKPVNRLLLDSVMPGNQLIVTNQQQMDAIADRFWFSPGLQVSYPSLHLIRLDSLKNKALTNHVEE